MTAPAPPRPRRDAVAHRDALVAAARVVLSQDPGASIDAVARAAGLSRRAVYGHFADRDALVAEVIATGAARFNAIAADTTADDPRSSLALLAARLWDEADHIRAAAALALDDAHIAATGAALAPVRARVREILTAGAAAGSLRPDIPVPVLARLVEESARGALRALADDRSPAARATAVRAVLGTAGLSWREADTVLCACPALTPEETR